MRSQIFVLKPTCEERAKMDEDRKARLISAANPLIEKLDEYQRSATLRKFGIYSHGALFEELNRSSDESLLALAEVFNLFEPTPSEFTFVGSPTGEPLLVFGSHIHQHQFFVGQVAEYLAQYGIELFVAHISIEPNSDWRNVIIQKLDTSHVGVAFLHPDFGGRDWCAQEIGWLLGRQVPVTSLHFGEDPKAFLGQWQANAAISLSALEVGLIILNFIKSKPELNSNLIDSLVSALNNSRTYSQTILIWDQLKGLDNLSVTQCSRLMDALEDNNQVYEPHDWHGGTYRAHICNYLEAQPASFGVANRLAYFRLKRLDAKS